VTSQYENEDVNIIILTQERKCLCEWKVGGKVSPWRPKAYEKSQARCHLSTLQEDSCHPVRKRVLPWVGFVRSLLLAVLPPELWYLIMALCWPKAYVLWCWSFEICWDAVLAVREVDQSRSSVRECPWRAAATARWDRVDLRNKKRTLLMTTNVNTHFVTNSHFLFTGLWVGPVLWRKYL
jgi:hypothetical protein